MTVDYLLMLVIRFRRRPYFVEHLSVGLI